MHAARSLVEPIPYGQWTLQQAWRCRSSCARPSNRPYGERESGGRSTRQPGQVLTEAATTNSLRVVPAPTFLSRRPLIICWKRGQEEAPDRQSVVLGKLG